MIAIAYDFNTLSSFVTAAIIILTWECFILLENLFSLQTFQRVIVDLSNVAKQLILLNTMVVSRCKVFTKAQNNKLKVMQGNYFVEELLEFASHNSPVDWLLLTIFSLALKLLISYVKWFGYSQTCTECICLRKIFEHLRVVGYQAEMGAEIVEDHLQTSGITCLQEFLFRGEKEPCMHFLNSFNSSSPQKLSLASSFTSYSSSNRGSAYFSQKPRRVNGGKVSITHSFLKGEHSVSDKGCDSNVQSTQNDTGYVSCKDPYIQNDYKTVINKDDWRIPAHRRNGISKMPMHDQPVVTGYTKPTYAVLVGNTVQVYDTSIFASLPHCNKFMVKEKQKEDSSGIIKVKLHLKYNERYFI